MNYCFSFFFRVFKFGGFFEVFLKENYIELVKFYIVIVMFVL